MNVEGSLEGRIALVTGAARGLGFAIAQRLVRAGASVWLNGRDRAALDEAADRIGSDARVLAFDIGDDVAHGSAMMLSRQMSGFQGMAGHGLASSRRLAAATAALTTFPGLVLMAIAITMVFAFTGFVFLIALAL